MPMSSYPDTFTSRGLGNCSEKSSSPDTRSSFKSGPNTRQRYPRYWFVSAFASGLFAISSMLGARFGFLFGFCVVLGRDGSGVFEIPFRGCFLLGVLLLLTAIVCVPFLLLCSVASYASTSSMGTPERYASIMLFAPIAVAIPSTSEESVSVIADTKFPSLKPNGVFSKAFSQMRMMPFTF